jgi:hypothetical protein
MRITAIIFAVLSFAALAAGQTTGRLTGTVSGPDGVIPGATVLVRDNQTGREVTVQASSDGSFTVPQLEFGTYTVTVTASGFKTYTANDLKIDIGREYTLNPTLEVGGIEETVTVSAGADIINSSNAELSNTVSPRQVIDLPINGRNPLALVSLQPGANATSQGINGQRSTAINVTRDGINVQDNFIRTGAFVSDQPTVDDTGEFTVTTQNAGAEQGGGGSSQIQLVTPRGGQDFHGAGFIFNRNSKFSANNFFNNASGTEQPFLNRNQVGGKLSGPLPFFNFGEGGPMFVKNKAFFFVAYERLFLRQQTSGTNTVLLGTARDGTFTYTDNNGIERTINVLTGAGLDLSTPENQTLFNTAGGVLSVDPVVQTRLLNNIPSIGNVGLPTNNGLTQQFRQNVRNSRDRDSFVTRIDYDFNSNNSINIVYRYLKDVVDRPDVNFGFDPLPFVIQDDTTQLITGAYRTIIGSNMTNEFRIGYTSSEPFFNQDERLNANFLIEDATLPFNITNPEPTVESQGRDTRLYTIRDDAVYAWGNHSLRFGGQYENQKIVSSNSGGTTPTFFFSTTANPNTPRLAASLFPGGISAAQRTRADTLRYFLGGIIGAGQVLANPTSGTSGPVTGATLVEDLRYSTVGLYISDQWRVRPNLTLNFGVRYDYFTPLRNPDQVFLEPVIPEGADPVATILNPVGSYDIIGTSIGKPGQFFKGDKNNFGPQLSFAWSPNFLGEGTTIRGGYRMSYINDEYLKSILNAYRGNDGLSVTVNAVDIVNGTPDPDLNRRLSNISGSDFPAPAFLPPPFTFAQANAIEGTFFNTIFAADPNLQTPRIHEYNIGIQRELGFNTALEIRYVGGRSDSLVRAFDFNQVNIRDTGFVEDFLRAQNNCRLQAAAVGASGLNCTDASFNPNIAGSQPLPIFDMLPFGAFLNNSLVITQLQNGTPADLAVLYITNGLDIDGQGGGVNFRANPNAGPVDFVANAGVYRYNALQVEVRRRFADGLYFQGNYTFQKSLTDVPEEDQNRFDPFLDIANQRLEYSRSDLDRTHAINFNAIYELPFGKGRAFLNRGGWVDALFGGYQLSSIIQYASGAPISIRDPRGTLNRAGRSGRQTAFSNLTKEQIKDLIGIFRTPNGIYFIDPSVIAPDGTATGSNPQATPDNPAFPGQVFFNVQPGQTGNLERAFINGPDFLTVDLGLSKRFRFTERFGLQLRAEAFNVFNRANFFAPSGVGDGATGENSDIFNVNSPTFGRITGTFAPRILQFGARLEF